MPYANYEAGLTATRNRLRRFREQDPERWRAYQRKWNKANRGKYLAHKAVEYAVKVGKLVRQPCFCGAKAHAHHDDYSKPLTVTWLCPKHHKERHRQLAAQKSDPDT